MLGISLSGVFDQFTNLRCQSLALTEQIKNITPVFSMLLPELWFNNTVEIDMNWFSPRLISLEK